MPTAPQLPQLEDTSDEDIQKLLAGQPVQGPRAFRGRELAKYTKGLRDLVMKVVRPDDTGLFHDVVLLHVLGEAPGATPEDAIARRRALITATDDVEGFRARVSVEVFDALTDDEILEARRLASSILAPVQAAQVSVAAPGGKKKRGAAPRTPNPTTTL